MKTTKQVLTNLLIFITSLSFSQDIIIDKKGNEIKCDIIEENYTEVKFKTDASSGFVSTVLQSDIVMIKYEDGTNKVFATKSPPASKEKHDATIRKRYSGPRVGVTVLGPGRSLDRLKENGKAPIVSQFGWQLETRAFSLSNGTSGLIEFVGLIGGLEQGMVLPSLSILFGVRSGKKGLEAAIGPNLSLSGLGTVIAIGGSFNTENICFPVNLVFIPSVSKKEIVSFDPFEGFEQGDEVIQTGVRVSLLIGFNVKRK